MRKRLVIAGAVISVFVLAGWSTGGWVTGVEWSPDTFQHRSFRYYAFFSGVVPPEGIPVSPRETHVWESELESWLKTNGYVKERPEKPRWYFIKGFAPNIRGWSGSAKPLCYSLRCWGGGDEYWIGWSERHPEIATDLWPTIVRLVRENEELGPAAAANLLDSLSEETTKESYQEAKNRVTAEYGRDVRLLRELTSSNGK